ncbi:MAG: leucine-rich repeat protein [Prevotella sp.]|nr:leucine-rich repeat protein [Prevotella sp.]
MKQFKLILMLLMAATSMWAETYTDTNGVIYVYTPGKSTAYTQRGGGTGFDSDPTPGHEGLSGNIEILESFTVDGQTYIVTEIGWATFMNNKDITSVTIPKTVTIISPVAFYGCTGLTDIYCYANPNYVEWGGIVGYSDGKPNKGTVLHVPSNYLSKYENEFDHLNFTFNGDLPEADENEVVSGNLRNLLYWIAIKNGTVPVKDKITGQEVEKPKYRLILYYPSGSGVMPIGYSSNSQSPWTKMETIAELVVDEGVQSISTNAFQNLPYLTKVSLPKSGFKSIDNFAFSGADIAEITLPEGLESIGGQAFIGNTSMKSIKFPASLTSLFYNAFANNDLETITVDAGNTVYNSPEGSNAVIRTADNELVLGCKTTVIPKGVVSIGKWAFYKNTLSSIDIPEGVTSIGQYALAYCKSLKSVVLPNSITTIDQQAFYYMTEAKEFVIGSGVTSIGTKAFCGCEKLADVLCYADPAALTWDGYDNASNFMANKATTIHVKKADLTAWQEKFPDINATFKGDLDGEPVDDGDVDGDGKVTAADVEKVVNIIAGLISDDKTKAAADVNGDGKVDIADIIALVNLLLGK